MHNFLGIAGRYRRCGLSVDAAKVRLTYKGVDITGPLSAYELGVLVEMDYVLDDIPDDLDISMLGVHTPTRHSCSSPPRFGTHHPSFFSLSHSENQNVSSLYCSPLGQDGAECRLDTQARLTSTIRVDVVEMLRKINENLELALSKKTEQLCFPPELTEEGTGGTYRLYDTAGIAVGFFKPKCEEVYAPHNPRGKSAPIEGIRGIRPGVLSGQQACREVAACLLDFGGLAGVPTTVMVRSKHRAYNINPDKKRSCLTEKDEDSITSICLDS